jgi:hypothetical protein
LRRCRNHAGILFAETGRDRRRNFQAIKGKTQKERKIMNEIEKVIVGMVTDIASLVTEIGQTQSLIATYLSERLSNLTDVERQHLLAGQSHSQEGLHVFQQKIERLKSLL